MNLRQALDTRINVFIAHKTQHHSHKLQVSQDPQLCSYDASASRRDSKSTKDCGPSVCVWGGSQTVVAKWSMKKSKETRRGETKDLSHRVKTCRQTFASVCRIWRVLTWWSVRSNTPDKLNIHHSYFLFPTRLLSFQRDISVKHLLNYTTRCQWTFVGRTYETGKEQYGINRG